jgi:nucleotide-binding universal stress UspA family protein
MYNTILVPLDGSERAEAILPYVETLAQRCSAKVIFIQVVEPPPYEGPHEHLPGGVLDRHIKQAESYLTGLQKKFREKGIEAQTRVEVYGPVVAGIMDAAQAEGADLIALSSHGRTGLPEVFYGSVAAGVLHRADRPLLLVRSQ